MSAKERRVFTAFTHAGGAGKTSLVRDLGFELSRRGYRVLLVDADPQANLTAWLGVEPSEDRSLLKLIREGVFPEPVEVAPKYHLVPSDVSLALTELEISRKPLGELVLRGGLRRLSGQYDFVLVDSLPSLGKIAVMAALAGDGLILPVEVSPKGLQAALTVLDLAREYLASLQDTDPSTREFERFVALAVPTRYDPRTATGRAALEAVQGLERLGVPVAPPLSSRPGPYGRAADAQVPIHGTGSSEAVEEVQRVAEAFLQAVGAPLEAEGVRRG
jgi:chromosome partitioning protein